MKAFNTHIQFWQNTTALYAELTQAMLSGAARMPKATGDEGPTTPASATRNGSKHPFFYYLKRQYQIMSAYLESLAETADLGDDKKHSEQIHFFTHQLVDLFSPSNFLASNPGRHQEGGRDQRPLAGRRPREPGEGSRAQRAATCWSRCPIPRPSGSARASPTPRAMSSTRPIFSSSSATSRRPRKSMHARCCWCRHGSTSSTSSTCSPNPRW